MKKHIYYYLVVFAALIFTSKQSKAQESNLLKELRIPQILQENPGALLPYNGHVSFPALGRIQVGVNLPFNYGDLYDISDKTLKRLHRNNVINTTVQMDLLHFGFRVNKKNYISIFSSIKTDVHFAFRKDLARFVIEGNVPYEGETMSFLSNDFLSVNAYAEIGVGYNRELNDKLSFGVNAKYLMGLANAYSKKADLSLYTGSNFDELILNYALEGKYAGVIDIEGLTDSDKKVDYSEIPQNLKNHGFALDLGARYRINKWFEVNASVLDLGFIKWKANTKQYNVEEGTFSITGYGYDDVFGESGSIKDFEPNDYLTAIGDSLKNIFDKELEPSGSYVKWLNTKITIGGSFFINEKNRINAVFNGKFINGKFVPNGTISYVFNAGRWFDFVIGNTFRQNAFFNPGFGLNFTGGVFQFYLVVNYANTFIYIDKAKNFNFAFGINFVAPQKKEKASKTSYPY
jgi:hypothetical protein